MADEINERVLTVDQRRKRSMAMRRNKEKLLRARERAKGRQAPDKNIKQRAYKLARELARKKVAGDRGANYANMSDSEKIQMDKLLDTPEKIKMIKKMAERLIPKVRRMEQDRLQSFMKGHQLKNLGQKEGNHHMKEDLNSLFNEYFAGGVPGRGALGGPAQNSNKMIGKDKDDKKDNGSPIKQYEPFNGKKEAKIKEALDRKSEKSGIDFDVLAEVFVRGIEAYPDNCKVTLEQYAFARVNSFINQGKTYFNEDADLQEACASTAKVKKLEKEVDELEAAHKSPSAHKKSLKNEDTDLQELSKKTLTSYLQKTKNGTGKDFPNPLSFRKSMEAQGIAKAKLGKKPKRSSVPDVKVMAGGKKSVKEDTDLQEAEVKNHYYVTYNSMEKGHKLLHPKKKPFTSMLDAKRHIEKIAPGHPERRSVGRIHTVNVATGRITSITNYDGERAGYPSTPGIGDSKELHQLKETFDMEDFKKKMAKDKETREKYSGYYQTPKGSGNIMGHDHDKPEHVIIRVNKSTGVRSKNNDEYEDHSVHPKDLKVYKDGKWSPIKEEKMKGKDPCWKNYKMVGKKMKNGKEVPNCVPESVTPVEGEGSSARKQIQTVPRATDNRKTTGRSTHQQEVLKKVVEQKLGNVTADPKKRLTGTDSLVSTYKADTPFAEDANSSDRKPVVVPSFTRRNDDGSTVTIPAKTVLRKSNRKILGSGNPHDGKSE